MNIYDLLFTLQLAALLIILGLKGYNVLSGGKVYDFRMSVILFSGYFIIWIIGYIIFALEPTEILYMQLFRLGSWFITLNVILTIIEIFYTLYENIKKPVQSYKANQIK